MSKHEGDILRAVDLRGQISVAELARALGVSDQTIRRIAKPLVEAGRLKKVHGALVSAQSRLDPPYLARMNRNRGAKIAIAEAVLSEVRDGASLAIDTGSTSGFVARALRARRGLTVVTNSVFIASTLAMEEGNRVFMAGTELRNHDGAAFDRAAYRVIAGFAVDIALLSASLVHPERGFLVFDHREVDMATAMMEIAERKILAVDASKFRSSERKPALKLPDLGANDLLVTEQRPPAAFDALLRKQSLRVAAPL